APRAQGDKRPVLHPRLAEINLKLIVGDRLGAEFDRAQPVVELVVPLLAGLQRFEPGAFRGLKVLRPQEHSFVPVNWQVLHCATYWAIGKRWNDTARRPAPGGETSAQHNPWQVSTSSDGGS